MLNTYLLASLIIIGSAVVAIVGLLLFRKIVKVENLRPSHEVGGYLLSVVGTMYAVLVGLVVVDAMQHYQHARDVTQKETNNLADIFILAKAIPDPKRSTLQAMCRRYVNRVVDTEWSLMKCNNFCPVARDLAGDLMESLMDFEPKTENEKAIYPQMIEEASQFWQNRQERISMTERGLPNIEWIALDVGAVMIVFFTYFFALENIKLQMVMTAIVAMLIALNLSLILVFAYPFSGDTAVQADAFKSVKYIFDRHPAAAE